MNGYYVLVLMALNVDRTALPERSAAAAAGAEVAAG